MGPSVVALAKADSQDGFFSDIHNIKLKHINRDDIILEPTTVLENWGSEDPRVFYRSFNKLYYLFYTGA